MDAARRKYLNEETTVAELPHGIVVLAQPGFDLNRDAKSLKENFGITDQSVIKTLGESKGAIPEPGAAAVEDTAPARRRAATPEA